LWATQRIGWLAAEKRKNGGSSEIDDEIRQLGERFSIPTEFTSYLVQEPGMVSDRLRRGGVANQGAAAPAAAPMPARDRAFESAKAASAQRVATSVAALDSMSAGYAGASGAVKRAASHTFIWRDSMWTDVKPADAASRTVRIKAFSKAYFDLIDAVPDLRAVFAIGDRVTVRGRAVTVVVSESGAEQLSVAELRSVMNGW
jgi:Ca-activated chloride channel family protein